MATTLHLTDHIELRIDDDTAQALAEQLHAAGFSTTASAVGPGDSSQTYDDGHPIWDRHSGGSGHYAKPEWAPGDEPLAEAYYASVHGKARTFLDLLIVHPGRRFSTDELRRFAPGVWVSDHSIAGSVKGLSKSQQASERRYPFYWWQDRPTRYGMKPGVAALFEHARQRGR